MGDEERLARRQAGSAMSVPERLVTLAGLPDRVATGMRGLNGSRTFEFKTAVRHGAGSRDVAVEVSPETILYLAAAMMACPAARTHPGHAMWHIQHGKPTESCGRFSVQADGAPLHACIRCGSDYPDPDPAAPCRTCDKDGFTYLRAYGP